MESLKPEMQTTIAPAVSAVSISTSRLSGTVRSEKPILELPKLVPVTDPKPSIELPQQQSVLKKSVTTTSPPGGLQNLIKLVPRTIPIKTVQGPNGNFIVHGPHNRILSLQIKGANQQTPPQPGPLSLVPFNLPKETKSAMLKLSGLSSIQARKITPMESINPVPTKPSVSKESMTTLRTSNEVVITSKPTLSMKATSQELNVHYKPQQQKEPSASLKLSPTVTSGLATSTTQVINTLVASKALEIKAITIADSQKALTPAQAATVPMGQQTSPTISKSKSLTSKPDLKELDTITIEKKIPLKFQLNKGLQPKKDGTNEQLSPEASSTVRTLPSNKMISLQISNGRLSDPNGPIKLISANSNVVIKEQQSKVSEKLESEPVEQKALDAIPIDGKSKPPKSIELRMLDPSSIEPKAAKPKPKDSMPEERKPIDSNPDGKNSVESKLLESKSVEPKHLELNPIEIKSVEMKSIEPPKPIETILIELKPAQPKSGETSSSLQAQWAEFPEIQKPLTPPPCPITIDLDKPLKNPSAPNKQTKPKQQSLLRNKAIEMLQRSPRTKCRSKSLTTIRKKLGRPRRRISAASDGDIGKPHVVKKTSISPPIAKNPPENQVKKLLCPEKISTSSDSLGSSSPIEEKNVAVRPAYAPTEIIEMNSSEDECKIVKTDGVSSLSKVNENEVYSCLNWQDGVGLLKESNLQFQFNEFGLIEILESDKIKTELDYHYEKPIFEREFKSQKTLDYKNPYFCKGCNCKGAAVDFLTPEFCSRECIRRYNGRSNNSGGSKQTKKYTNRKKSLLLPEDIKKDPQEVKPEITSLLKSSKMFSWDTYLSNCKGEPTPIDLFLNPFPCSSNMFQVRMKLEAIDPENSTLFCVCTIVEKKGYRLKLHFDGYSKYYDFWVNADSMDIFPPGWCAKTNRTLQPPRGISSVSFNWPKYLNQTKALPAPRNLFTHLNSSSQTHGFKVGMKIEADDLRNSGKVCVATVADILDNRLLIVFDEWDDSYSYWIDVNSPYIHAVNWHKKNGFSIVPPPDLENRFSWGVYLAYTHSEPATEDLFRTRDPIDFKPGMKLEVVDKRNPSLIRPASVIMTDDYEIKVLFEGWPMEYAFWVEDDSPDIHPIGWCEITNHELEAPPGILNEYRPLHRRVASVLLSLGFDSLPTRYDCTFPGCRGIGNALHPELDVHTNILSCPYEAGNWTKEIDKSGRLTDYSRFDETLLAETKPKDILPRNKRKSELMLRPTIPTKLLKYQAQPYQPVVAKPAPIQISATSGVSLLAKKPEPAESIAETRINIARHLLCDYGPRLQQVYSLWKQNSECLAVNLAESKDHSKNPMEWTADEVAEYIAKLPRCQAISQEFLKQEIDGSAFLSMRQSDLTDILKVKLGHAIKIYNQIVQLREDVVTRFLANKTRVS